MSMSNGEAAMRDSMRDLADQAAYQRLEKDVTAVKNDIAALTDQITDALNTFAGAASRQARRGYKQARGCDHRGDAGGCHFPAPARDRGPRARTWLPDRRDVAPVN